MKHKIVYYLPLEIYLNEKKIGDNHNILIKMLYSILTVNANLDNEIVIFTDFTGMSTFSILPVNFKIIHSNTINNFYNNVIKELKNENYLIMHESHILKMCTIFKGEYINHYKKNDDAIINDFATINSMEIKDMLNNINEISNTVYNKFIDNIKKYVDNNIKNKKELMELNVV